MVITNVLDIHPLPVWGSHCRPLQADGNTPTYQAKPVAGVRMASSHTLGESLWRGWTLSHPTHQAKAYGGGQHVVFPHLQYRCPQGQQNKVCRPGWQHAAPGTAINNAWVWVVGPNGNHLQYRCPQGQQNKVCWPGWQHAAPGTTIK